MYPATESVLLPKLGWSLVWLEEGGHVRLDELLKDMLSKVNGRFVEVKRETKLK